MVMHITFLKKIQKKTLTGYCPAKVFLRKKVLHIILREIKDSFTLVILSHLREI
jgi:hypothetical protein